MKKEKDILIVFLNSIDKNLSSIRLWVFLSFLILSLYLIPLVVNGGIFYTLVFDNLDSTIVWYKILAESGMLFATNNATIPNMMNGLPRFAYPSELNIMTWLYFFFKPQVAYAVNEFFIHSTAFFSMYVFLKRYIVKPKHHHGYLPIFASSLYFALIPYWSGAGLSIAILPLVTYSLLNIKNKIGTKWDWFLLVLLPFYSSFIFTYMFYIVLASIYLIWDTIKNQKLNKQFFLALLLMGTVFLLVEYRLIVAMLIDSDYISHRTEFHIFYTKKFIQAYIKGHYSFLYGHPDHSLGLQSLYVLPIIVVSMLLSVMANKQFTIKISILFWVLLISSYLFDVWKVAFKPFYLVPALTIFALYIIFFQQKYKKIGLLVLLQIGLVCFAMFQWYEGFESILYIFPMFNELNLTRIAFIGPFLWAILFAYSLQILSSKVYLSNIIIAIFILAQTTYSFEQSYFLSKNKQEYASFQDYYAPDLFKKVKEAIPEPIESIRVVSYGLEPAVSLYNGFYTVDGYSANFPLGYKHKFRKVIASEIDGSKNLYDDWGSKAYILAPTITLSNYTKDTLETKPIFDVSALCELKTNYIISSYEFNLNALQNLTFIKSFLGNKDSWNIYLYHIDCATFAIVP